MVKKVDEEGSGRTAQGMDQQDGVGQAWRWNLSIGKWATHPYAPARGTQAAGEEWRVERKPPEKNGAWRRVESCLPAGFPPTCRSVLCTSESEVSDQRRASRKKSPPTRRFDGEVIRQQRQRRRVLEGK